MDPVPSLLHLLASRSTCGSHAQVRSLAQIPLPKPLEKPAGESNANLGKESDPKKPDPAVSSLDLA